MRVEISEKSKNAFITAAEKLNISPALPDLTGLRPDLAHWLTANYIMAVIIEADKNGKIYDITNHEKRKYEIWHTASDGYEPGTSGGGFSYHVCDSTYTITNVGARLTFNSAEEGRTNATKYPDLWEIIMLNVK